MKPDPHDDYLARKDLSTDAAAWALGACAVLIAISAVTYLIALLGEF